MALESPDYCALSLRLDYEHAPLAGLKLKLRGAYAARSIAALAAGLEFKLLSLGPATFAGLADYQLGLSEGPLIGERLDHGPSAGLRLYLARGHPGHGLKPRQ